MSPDLGQRGCEWSAVTAGDRLQSGGGIAALLGCTCPHQLRARCVAASAGTGTVSFWIGSASAVGATPSWTTLSHSHTTPPSLTPTQITPLPHPSGVRSGLEPAARLLRCHRYNVSTSTQPPCNATPPPPPRLSGCGLRAPTRLPGTTRASRPRRRHWTTSPT